MTQNAPDILRSFFKRWPVFYYFVAVIFGPLMFGGLSPQKFLKKYHRSGKTLNIGSGPKKLGPGITNVDIYPYQGVDIVADASSIPVPTDSVARIISDNVLEHIINPKLAVAEMHRILLPGGLAYVCIPYMYPFHASPNDFQRWTHAGMRELMKGFEILEMGVRAGPFSTITVMLCYLCATIFAFGSERLYWILVNIFMVTFFPIKLLDLIFNRWPFAKNMAAVLYCVVEKQ